MEATENTEKPKEKKDPPKKKEQKDTPKKKVEQDPLKNKKEKGTKKDNKKKEEKDTIERNEEKPQKKEEKLKKSKEEKKDKPQKKEEAKKKEDTVKEKMTITKKKAKDGEAEGGPKKKQKTVNTKADIEPKVEHKGQGGAIKPKSKPRRRLALVIGNSKYKTGGVLANASKDARDMAQALEKLGFLIHTGNAIVDADSKTMKSSLREFAKELESPEHVDTIAFFYFAGHGVHVENDNYLLPVDDQELNDEHEISKAALGLLQVNKKMQNGAREQKGISVQIVDACRAKVYRGGQNFVRTDAVNGTMQAYACSPEQFASDGVPGENGLFTHQLLKHITRKDSFYQILVDAKDAVRERNTKQMPQVAENMYKPHLFRIHN